MDAVGQTAIDIAAIGLIAMTATQLIKRALPGDGYGPYVSCAVAGLCVLLWIMAYAPIEDGRYFPSDRTLWFTGLAAWVAVWQTAAGTYGLARIVTDNMGSDGASERPPVAATGAVPSGDPGVSSSPGSVPEIRPIEDDPPLWLPPISHPISDTEHRAV